MRCPTCNQTVANNQNICSFCGGLVREIQSQLSEPSKNAQHHPEALPVPTWEMHPARPVEFPRNSTLEPPMPSPESEEDILTPRRRVPLIRVLVLLAFLLVPILRVFTGNFHTSFTITRPRSVLREVSLCEKVEQGEPLNAKSVFSIKTDENIFIFTRWSPVREDSQIAFRWRSPEGDVSASSNGVQIQASRGEMIAVGRIGLDSSMPNGLWQVDVLSDGVVRATINFEIKK